MIIHGLRVQNVCRNMRVDTVRVEYRILSDMNVTVDC